MIARKTVATAASATLLLVCGIAFRNAFLIVASAPLAVILALSRLVDAEPRLGLEAGHKGPSTSIYEGESAEITVTIANHGSRLSALEVYDVLPEGLALDSGTNHSFVSLGEDERMDLSFTIRPRVFGIFRVGPVKVRAFSAAGFYGAEQTIDSTLEVKVYPKVQYVRRVSVKPPLARNWPGEILTNKPGSGMEFYGIRDYSQGDPLRWVNWRASARSPELLTNQYRGEFGGDAIIVLDGRTQSEVGAPPESTLTYSIRATAVMAYRLLRDRNRVGLLALGSNLQRVKPGFGRRQFEVILTAVAGVRAGGAWGIENVPAYLSIFFSRLNQVVLVTPLADAKSYSAVVNVAAKGYPTMVVSPSPIEFERRPTTSTPIEGLAEELIRLERDSKIAALRRYATVADWDTREPLEHALRLTVLPRMRQR